MFNISGIVGQIGNNAVGYKIYVTELDTELNERGDETVKTRTDHMINGVVQIVSAEDDEVREGILRPEDLICFFDEDESNSTYLTNYNQIKYRDKYYKIVQVIHEIGHYEVLAKKV